MQPDLHCRVFAARTSQQFRTLFPLSPGMTNDVAQNFTANMLPVLGASPAMATEPEEADSFIPAFFATLWHQDKEVQA